MSDSINHSKIFLLEEIETSSSSKSLQLKKSSLIKNSQSGPSNRDNQQKQISLKISSFDVLNESSNINQRTTTVMKTIFLLDDTTVNQSFTYSQQSLKAITDTLQTIFGSSAKQSPEKAKKRTVLKRPSGKIMTEADVINQMEEANTKKHRRSRSSSQQPNAIRRGKKRKEGKTIRYF